MQMYLLPDLGEIYLESFQNAPVCVSSGVFWLNSEWNMAENGISISSEFLPWYVAETTGDKRSSHDAPDPKAALSCLSIATLPRVDARTADVKPRKATANDEQPVGLSYKEAKRMADARSSRPAFDSTLNSLQSLDKKQSAAFLAVRSIGVPRRGFFPASKAPNALGGTKGHYGTGSMIYETAGQLPTATCVRSANQKRVDAIAPPDGESNSQGAQTVSPRGRRRCRDILFFFDARNQNTCGAWALSSLVQATLVGAIVPGAVVDTPSSGVSALGVVDRFPALDANAEITPCDPLDRLSGV
ncbi:hypothetical protein WN55_00193 [Dufourea novaeangliae]|uniref:Uncharacterized protein n=1 Tax=Dufourea novaeangliae TaxID=178035 RepID=A0A154PCG1_DUFNO|nr:hypothetical protein WN55_00193 [Dufourea novaeangliae]